LSKSASKLQGICDDLFIAPMACAPLSAGFFRFLCQGDPPLRVVALCRPAANSSEGAWQRAEEILVPQVLEPGAQAGVRRTLAAGTLPGTVPMSRPRGPCSSGTLSPCCPCLRAYHAPPQLRARIPQQGHNNRYGQDSELTWINVKSILSLSCGPVNNGPRRRSRKLLDETPYCWHH
jgi:hypothetical protein